MKLRLSFIALLCISLLPIANTYAEAPSLNYQLLAERNHNSTFFTQGLLVDNNKFYESSGLYGQSQLVSYYVKEPDPTWAAISVPFLKRQRIDEHFFAEGLTLLNNQLFLLTWQEKTLFVFDKETFALQKKLTYEGEGWGLTSDGKNLIRSDGSDTLFFHSPNDFSVIKTITIKDGNLSIKDINELEYAQGFIWANVWYKNHILKIDPTTGKVLATVDFSALKQSLKLNSNEYVLNGIAWDEQQHAFWITGKKWPKMFLVKIQ